MCNSDKIKAIELAAVLEFGNECCLPLKQIRYPETEGKSPFYRLDVQRGEVNSHAVFDLRKDITEEEIRRKFIALNVSYEEYMEKFARVPTDG